jgi:hypothetical protein
LEILFLFVACVCDQELKQFYPGTDESAFDSIVITICKKPNFPDVFNTLIAITLSWSGTDPNPESITTLPFPLSHHYTLGQG